MRSDRLSLESASYLLDRKLIGTAKGFAVGLDPMFLEGVLYFARERPFDTHLNIVPMFRVLCVPGPLFREPDRAGEGDLAIDDENAPVRAAVTAIDPPGEQWMVIGKFAAGLLEHPDIGIVELRSGAEPIQEDAHFNPGASAFAECVAKGPADFIRVNNVSLEI